MSAWVIGPGWATSCSAPQDGAPLEAGPAGFIAYLRTLPGLVFGDATETTVDGHPASSLDVTAGTDSTFCGEDSTVHLWKESDNEATLPRGRTSRIVALDVDGATVAFEIWGPQAVWGQGPQAILDTIRFDPAGALTSTVGRPADDGARIVRVDALDERTRDLTIESPSVGYAKVRLLLPARFDAEPSARWPVLYLLQGCCDDYTSWTRETDVAELTAQTDLLVVMPGAGGSGWYSDWWNGGKGGRPAWETFHLVELRQLIERNWQAGEKRVVAGLSMGGFGAMSYAARHPDMFLAAASYSGVMDTVGSDFEAEVAQWGDKIAQADIWEAHNPLSLAPALAGLPLYVAYGDGHPGPLDAAGTVLDGQEQWIAKGNDAFVDRLKELGISATVDAYGPGTHSWPYWERALHQSLPLLLDALGETSP
jgi:diacylglycerol O-acyltransferase / trehalose O-mycolyltransferase